jgi:hypothetical protein
MIDIIPEIKVTMGTTFLSSFENTVEKRGKEQLDTIALQFSVRCMVEWVS